MLSRAHVLPFTRERDGALEVSFLAPDEGGRVVAYLDRLCRLVRRLERRPRRTVAEALRRQDRRVRDARRLAGVAKALLDACELQPPPGAARARARGPRAARALPPRARPRGAAGCDDDDAHRARRLARHLPGGEARPAHVPHRTRGRATLPRRADRPRRPLHHPAAALRRAL